MRNGVWMLRMILGAVCTPSAENSFPIRTIESPAPEGEVRVARPVVVLRNTTFPLSAVSGGAEKRMGTDPTTTNVTASP